MSLKATVWFMLFTLLTAFGLFCLGVFLEGCFRPSPSQVRAMADATCTLVEAFSGSPDAESICAVAPEIAEMVARIEEERRKAREKGTPGSYARTSRCRIIPTTTMCAEEKEIAAAIRAVRAQR